MAPKGTAHKRKQHNRKNTRLMKSRMEDLNVKDTSHAEENAPDTATAEDDSPDTTTPPTAIDTRQYPLYERWEQIEAEEAARVSEIHASRNRTMWPQKLPVFVHVAAPQVGRFTREVESDIQQMNSIQAVKDLVEDSMSFELIRAEIDVSKVRFAGLMVYGPTTEFKKETMLGFSHGLFLHEEVYKKWWLSVDAIQRKPGDMVKIACVLWHDEEAAARRKELAGFWTNPTARMLGSHLILDKLETGLWDLNLEKGGRTLAKMQEQMLELKIEKEHLKAEAMLAPKKTSKASTAKDKDDSRKHLAAIKTLEKKVAEHAKKNEAKDKQLADIADAVENGDSELVERLVAAWRKESKGKGKEVEEEEAMDEEMEEAVSLDDEGDDDDGEGEFVAADADASDDSDYVD